MTQDATDHTAPRIDGGVVPYLLVDGAGAADFYRRAFGAQEVAHHPEDNRGQTMHVHLHINGRSVMLSDPYPAGTCCSSRRRSRCTCPLTTWTRRGIGRSTPARKSSCRCRSCSGATATASCAIRLA